MPYQNAGPVDCSISPDLSKIKGKSAVVTGGLSGIGEAYVKALVNAGAYVTIGDISETDGQKIASSYKGNAQFCKCDVRNWDDQVSMFKAAMKNSPSKTIDIVVANAGISGMDPIFQRQDPDSDPQKPDLKILDTNLYGVMYTASLATHYFQKTPLNDNHDRCLVLQASLAGYVDLAGAPQYQVSKYGGRGFMVCARHGAGLEGVRVNTINPWFVNTPILSEAVTKHIVSKGVEFATVEDCAQALLRIAADKSINGRAFGIIPRSEDKNGYVDLDHDDYKPGDPIREWTQQAINLSHRVVEAAAGWTQRE